MPLGQFLLGHPMPSQFAGKPLYQSSARCRAGIPRSSAAFAVAASGRYLSTRPDADASKSSRSLRNIFLPEEKCRPWVSPPGNGPRPRTRPGERAGRICSLQLFIINCHCAWGQFPQSLWSWVYRLRSSPGSWGKRNFTQTFYAVIIDQPRIAIGSFRCCAGRIRISTYPRHMLCSKHFQKAIFTEG